MLVYQYISTQNVRPCVRVFVLVRVCVSDCVADCAAVCPLPWFKSKWSLTGYVVSISNATIYNPTRTKSWFRANDNHTTIQNQWFTEIFSRIIWMEARGLVILNLQWSLRHFALFVAWNCSNVCTKKLKKASTFFRKSNHRLQ